MEDTTGGRLGGGKSQEIVVRREGGRALAP